MRSLLPEDGLPLTADSAFRWRFGSLCASTSGGPAAPAAPLSAAGSRSVRPLGGIRRSMNWEAIGAVGEVVGAVGVIATLIYLAAQIRQNSAVVRSATRQAISTQQAEFGMRVASSSDLRAAVARWLEMQPSPSSPEDALRDEFFLRSALRMFENQYHQNKDGTFEDTMWFGYLENMRRIFAQPRFRGWWRESRALYGTDFADFVDTFLPTDLGDTDAA